MKFTAQEEYGLRCLLQIGRQGAGGSLTIPEIALADGLSIPYVAKLMRLLRRGGFVTSTRGQTGGYTLARSAGKIVVGEVLGSLGGRFFASEFCDRHAGSADTCLHTFDCSIRPLWSAVQHVVDEVLDKTTLQNLIGGEQAPSFQPASLIQIERETTAAPA